MTRYKKWFTIDPNGEVWCEHRDITCCPRCFARDRRFVDVGGVVYLVPDEDTLAHFAKSHGDGITTMSPAYFISTNKTHPKATEPTMSHIESHAQYRQLLDALSVGDSLPDETYAAMVAFAKAKKIKTPPANNEPKPKPEKKPRVTKNVGHECKEKGCDREATSLGLCKKHHTAHWRQSPENLARTRRAARKHAAKKRYVSLVAAIGPGFHPDTSGADYGSLPEGITAERVDEVVNAAIEYELDVYALALDVVNA